MPTTTIGTFHSAATSTGNGSSLAVPSGDIVLNVSLVGSGPIGAVIQPQVSADNSTWVDLQPSTRIAGAGSVSSMVDVATTAAYIRVVLSEISGTNAAATVTLASFAPAAYASYDATGDGGIQGAFLGTFDDEASLPASATPGALATTRDGKSYVFAAAV